jgi:glyoxylase-like metal-dependent hydrolase (beta-lactamase superfamily II)
MRVTEETSRLFRLTRLGIINCFLVREDDGFSLVDTNLSGSGSSILAVAQRLGGPIRRILLTHAHFDHVGSLDALLAKLAGMELSIGSREARMLAGFPFAAWFSWDRISAAESARKLCNLNPTRLTLGHGKTITSPVQKLNQAAALALRQSGKNARLN